MKDVSKNRNLSLDIFKIVMSFFVVLLHLRFLGSSYPQVSHYLVNGLFRVAVPAFLIINGYFLYSTFHAGRFSHTIVSLVKLYVVWMVIYSYLWIKENHGIDILLTMIFGYHILWYFPGLILSAIMLLSLKNASTKTLSITAIVLYLIGYTIQIMVAHGYTENIIHSDYAKIITYRNFAFDCFPVLTAGYLLNKEKVGLPGNILKASIILSLILVLIESKLNNTIMGESFQSDIMISSPILAAILFIYFKQMNFQSRLNTKYLSYFSTALFLVHVACINLVSKAFKTLNISNDKEFVFLVIILSVFFAAMITYIKFKFKKSPLLP